MKERQGEDCSMDEVKCLPMRMAYPDAFRRIWKFTEQYSTLYALCCVRVDFENGYVEATNGRLAVRESIDFKHGFKTLKPVLLYGPDLKRIAKMFGDTRECGLVWLALRDGRWFAETDSVSVRIESQDGRFPDTSSIFNHKPAKSAKFAVSASELRRLLSACSVGELGGEVFIEVGVPLDETIFASLVCNSTIDARLCFAATDGAGTQKVVTIQASDDGGA